MVTLFANTFKTPYYTHVIGSLAQQFINMVAVTEHIEQKVNSGRILTSTKKRVFKRKMKEIDHVKCDYRGRKKQFQNYHTSPQIAKLSISYQTT